MSKWKPRDPSIYPVLYSDTVLRAISDVDSRSPRSTLLSSHRSKQEARLAADRFREWRFCLRSFGSTSHRVFSIERDFHIKLRTDHEGGMWNLYVEIVPRKLRVVEELNPALAGIFMGT